MAVNDLETELKNLENIADAILKNGYITEFLRYQYDTDWGAHVWLCEQCTISAAFLFNYNQNIKTIYYGDNIRLIREAILKAFL